MQSKLPLLYAGFPGSAPDLAEEQLDLNRLIVKHKSATYFMRIKGECMRGAQISDGDIAVVDRALPLKSGAIIALILDGKFFIKRCSTSEGKTYLYSEDNRLNKIRVDNREDFEYWGRVTYIIKKVL